MEIFTLFIGGPTLQIFFQLTLAMVLGVLLGMERSVAGKAAGMRTYALVTMGATLFVAIGVASAPYLSITSSVDLLRIAGSIITGIGFIGAGTIILRKDALKGLTTAAGLWVAAGIGMAIGFSLYMVAVFATLLTLFVFTILWYVEDYVEGKLHVSRTRVIETENTLQN